MQRKKYIFTTKMEDKVITLTNDLGSITDEDGFCRSETKHDS
jgi:hypothetical protein